MKKYIALITGILVLSGTAMANCGGCEAAPAAPEKAACDKAAEKAACETKAACDKAAAKAACETKAACDKAAANPCEAAGKKQCSGEKSLMKKLMFWKK